VAVLAVLVAVAYKLQMVTGHTAVSVEQDFQARSLEI
jgi:hypothetical protein